MPFPPPGELPDPGIKPAPLGSPALQADSLPVAPLGKYWGETRDTAKHPTMHRPPLLPRYPHTQPPATKRYTARSVANADAEKPWCHII